MHTVTSIANQAVFDLPWLVAQEAGFFAEEDNEASPQQAAGYHKEGHCL